MTAKPPSGVLIGLNEILSYLRISKPTFYKFIGLGMPAAVIDNRWYAHTDNLDAWFRRATLCRGKSIPEDAE